MEGRWPVVAGWWPVVAELDTPLANVGDICLCIMTDLGGLTKHGDGGDVNVTLVAAALLAA